MQGKDTETMKKLYYRLFYGAFLNGKKSIREGQSDKSAAVIGVMLFSALLFVNFLTIVIIGDIIGLNVVWNFFHKNSWILWFVVAGIIVFNYHLFLNKNRYYNVIQLFKDESKKQYRLSIFSWLFYLIITCVLLFVALDNNTII